MALGYDDGRRKAGEKDSNRSTVTERESEVAGEFVFGWGDVRLDSVKGMSNAANYAKELCMEESDQDVDGGVGEAVKAVCVKRAGYKGGFEAKCVGVGRKKIRRILMKLRSGGEGGGTAELQVEVGRWRGLRREEVYRM